MDITEQLEGMADNFDMGRPAQPKSTLRLAVKEITQLRQQLADAKADVDLLRKALLLAKEMFIVNNLSLPKTFEVIDEALEQTNDE